jgi:hypothetical protein
MIIMRKCRLEYRAAYRLVRRTWLSVLLSCLSLIGAGSVATADPVTQQLHEVYSLPDQRLVPGQLPTRRNEVSPAASVSRGRFVSVQVNVNEQGDNIIGDAANEPSIAVNPTDGSNLVIGWRQFPDVEVGLLRQAGWAYSFDRGESWNSPGVVHPFPRSDPVLDADADGHFYYIGVTASFNPDGTFDLTCELFVSVDRGLSWGPPIPLTCGDKPWMAVDRTSGIGAGNVYVSWASGEFTRSTDGGQSFESPVTIPDRPFFGTLAVGPEGDVYVVGRSPSSGARIAKSSDAQDPAAIPTFESNSVDLGGELRFGGVPNPGGLLGQPVVAIDHSQSEKRGNVYVLSSVDPPGSDPLDVMFIRSVDGGASWSEPIRINDDETETWQWFGTMSVAPNGRIDAIWNDTRHDPMTQFSEVYYAWSLDAGVTWSTNEAVTPSFDHTLGYPSQMPMDEGDQRKIGDYYHMVSDNGGANLAYAATFNGEQDVYFVRIPADCNANMIEDDCDTACGLAGGRCDVPGCGTEDDCNRNAIPDDCETEVECIEETCVGDCDEDGTVQVNELILAVNISLGLLTADLCDPVDSSNDGAVSVDEIVAAVQSALNGCPGDQTKTGFASTRRIPERKPVATKESTFNAD